MSRRRISSRTRRPRRRQRRGVVLVMVLAVVVILALSAYSFSDLMLSHYEGALYSGRSVQARLVIDSAVDATRVILIQDAESLAQMGGLYDNPELFQGVVVVPDEDPQRRGAFTIVAPQVDADGYYLGGVRYGLEDLSSRLNLNFLLVADELQEGAGRQLLMTVPGMTEDIADSILDFIDPDDEPRELGAESEYYAGMGIQAKNGPLDTIEELLEVKGITPELLFGADWNRNGAIDPHESNMGGTGAGGMGAGAANSGAAAGALGVMPGMERGWAPYVTLYSQEANLTREGLPRVYLNNEDLQALSDELTEIGLPEDWVTYILAYRLAGPSDSDDEGEVGATGSFDLTQEPRGPINQVLDLVNSKVQIQFDGDSESTLIESPFPLELGAMNLYLPMLMDKVTVNPAPAIPGRININQAPRAVLLGIPGMDEMIIEQILSLRVPESDGSNENLYHETWLLTEGVLLTEEGELDLEKMKTLMPFICARGDVYSAQIVGYFQEGGVSARVEVVFDATSPTMTVLMWRDMSHLGRGYPLEILGVDYGALTGGSPAMAPGAAWGR